MRKAKPVFCEIVKRQPQRGPRDIMKICGMR